MWKECVVPIVTALVGAFIAWMQDWLHRRDHDDRRKAALSEAGDRVQFLDSWLRAQQSVSAPEAFEQHKQRVREQLEATYATWLSSRDQSPPVHLSLATVFLIYRPRGLAAWLTHIVFYGYTILLACLVLYMAIDWKEIKDPPAVKIAVLVVYLIVFAGLRAGALRLRPKPAHATSSTAVNATV